MRRSIPLGDEANAYPARLDDRPPVRPAARGRSQREGELSDSWPEPTPKMTESAEFKAIWHAIRQWDIAVPHAYSGYCGATGNHVRAILDALADVDRKD